jgi:broad specificity phosphatase PhoE
MILVFVPHGAKVTVVTQYDPRLASDPPMTMEGKKKILEIVPTIRSYGPYEGVFSSMMDRACETMTTVVNALGDIGEVTCLRCLGQRANLDSDGTIIRYPGYEAEDNPTTWQVQVKTSIHNISLRLPARLSACEQKVLVFSHRPILAAMIAAAQGITDASGIQAILDDKTIVGPGFRVFRISDGGDYSITLLE